jgi:nucleotide-binding universal stress UspA family protein
MTKILACIDASTYAASVVELAGWAARGLDAEIELLHVVQRKDAVAARNDHSGAIGLGAKTELLDELTRIDAAAGRLAIEEGRIILEAGAARLQSAGFTVHQLHRHGGIVETIVEREADASLVVIGKRGASGEFAMEHIGSKVERVVRASDKPVLIAPREFKQAPRSVVVAYDDSMAATRAVAMIAESPLFSGMPIHLVSAEARKPEGRDILDRAAEPLRRAGLEVDTFVDDGKPEQVIPDYLMGHAEGILVMGAYGHSPLRTLIVGSTTTTMIRTVHVPILLVR